MSNVLRATSRHDPMAAAILCSFLLLLPALLLLYYISAFGVNVIFFDEWAMTGFIQLAVNRSLSFSLLMAQHNEHRIFFPRIAMLLLGSITQYNTIAEMYFGWALICQSALLIFYVYWTKFARGSYPKVLLCFLPVSFLLFSPRQQENILWGFSAVVFFLTVFGVVAAFSLLAVSKRIDLWFFLGLLGAALASFSSASGSMVWLVGAIQILLQDKRDVRKAVLWCVVGAASIFLYLNEYSKPPGTPPLTHIFTAPIDALGYFFALLGAPFAYDIATAGAIGFVTALIALIILILAYRGKILGANAIWLSLVLFAAASSLVTVVGRSGYGVQSALSSRYTSFTGLGIIGLYLVAFSESKKLVIKGKSVGPYAQIALMLVALIASYNGGWQAGQNDKDVKTISAYILKTYKIQSDENISNYLLPLDPKIVRDAAMFLEQNRLNVFSERVIDPATLLPIPSEALEAIDTINGRVISQDKLPLVIDQQQQPTLTIVGWAADRQVNDLASAVFVHIDETTDIAALYGTNRLDVANYFGNPNFRFSGYVSTFSSSVLSKGEHELSLKIVSKDGKYYYSSKPILHLTVN